MTARSRLARLPLRARLVAGFAAAMLVVLTAAGTFVYWRVHYALDRGLDTDLVRAVRSISSLVSSSGTVTDVEAADATGTTWQVVASDGTVRARGGTGSAGLVVAPSRIAGATTTFDVGSFLPASASPYRVRVSPLPGAVHLVVAVRRDHRDEALRELLGQLALAGLGALAVTALVGDRLARAALRPVETYRRRAAEIAAGAHHLRLDVPPDRDDEVTRLGHTFNTMLGALERSLERERQFVDEASHELRTPLTVVTSRVQLARRRRRTVDEHEQVLDELEIDLDRLTQLAEQLLRLGAATAGGPRGSGDLAAATSAALAHAPSDAVTLVIDADHTAVPLETDEAQRVVTNLVDNARRHGAEPIRVTVDRPTPDWARLVVTDAGPGMSPQLLETATQRFTRAEEARSRAGAGLGLALVEALVTSAGGELRLCSGGHHVGHGPPAPVPCDHGTGTTVTVLLPVVATPPPTP